MSGRDFLADHTPILVRLATQYGILERRVMPSIGSATVQRSVAECRQLAYFINENARQIEKADAANDEADILCRRAFQNKSLSHARLPTHTRAIISSRWRRELLPEALTEES